MKKRFFTMMAIAAALCACTKEEPSNPVQDEQIDRIKETYSPLVFTATMEGTPSSKATFDNTAKCASWEVGDQISINGLSYKANAAGTSSTFSMVGNGKVSVSEIRPTYVNGSPWTNNEGQAATMLVDDAGTSTKWCDHVNGDGLFIIVSTGNDCMLNSIKLWNGGDTGNRNGRRWKDVKVYGASSADGPWDSDALLASFTSLNLEANNGGFAGELPVNSTKEYKYYKVEVLSTMGESLQQMSDMKFVVVDTYELIRPVYVSGSPSSEEGYPAASLVDEKGTETKWESDMIGDMYIIVSTGYKSILHSIHLWNGSQVQLYPQTRWKDVKVYGSMYPDGMWAEIKSFENLDLAVKNKGFAGKLDVNSTESFIFYKVEVLSPVSGSRFQMSDMMFEISEGFGPYHVYFPTNLYNSNTASFPSLINETWADGKFNMPMYAYSENTELHFKNLCGVLKIIVKSNQIAKVKTIRISSANKAISGDFTIGGNAAAVLKNPDTPANKVTVSYNEAVTTTAEGTVFYIAIPAQTYQDLKIGISTDGINFDNMFTKSGVDILIERNKIYPITFQHPITGTEKATINGQQIDVPWVQLWSGGPKFAKYNLGVTDGESESIGDYYIRPDTHERARDSWGINWRTPTSKDFEGLLQNTTSVWTKVNNVWGRKYTGEGDYQDNSIFLPAAGMESRPNNSDGYYWTSTRADDHRIVSLNFGERRNQIYLAQDYEFLPIRPVVAD